jgi:hypothetical protein
VALRPFAIEACDDVAERFGLRAESMRTCGQRRDAAGHHRAARHRSFANPIAIVGHTRLPQRPEAKHTRRLLPRNEAHTVAHACPKSVASGLY